MEWLGGRNANEKQRSMPHESPEDGDKHSSYEVEDHEGKRMCVGHVTDDPSKQQVRPCLDFVGESWLIDGLRL